MTGLVAWTKSRSTNRRQDFRTIVARLDKELGTERQQRREAAFEDSASRNPYCLLRAARELATRWADDVEPRMSRATPEELAAWGWLLLQASAANLRDNRRGEAEDTMRLARSVAVMTGRELPRGRGRLTTWGPATVGYKAAERHIVLDQPDKVLAAVTVGSQAASTEYHRHRLDVAKAHVLVRQYGEAVDTLTGIHEAAPEWLASQRYAQDILGGVVEKRRTLTPQMRALADALSVPL
ncbi:hypothetical protein ACWC9R_03045 [Streptomyces sp. NPDC001219]